jgi:beta-N-acetylhexosaminidase
MMKNNRKKERNDEMIKGKGFRLRFIGYLFMILILFFSASGFAQDNYKIENILSRMSLEEKVGQVIFGFFRGPVLTPELEEMIRDYHLGGFILYTISGNAENPLQVASLVNAIQYCAEKNGQIPPLVSIDQEGGLVARLTEGVTVFPGNMALGATRNTELAQKAAEICAQELRILGITLNFAPVVDVNSNPANPIIGIRSFGSDPEIVSTLGTVMIEPYKNERVLCTAKHFPGHGDAGIDSHTGLPFINRSREDLKKVELVPFLQMVHNGVPAIMSAHIVVPDLSEGDDFPATLSKEILSILRDDWGFNGLIITDSMGMGAIDQHWGMEEASILAFQAGSDVLLFGADKNHEPAEQKAVHHALLEAVQTGRISESRLNESVKRILHAKADAAIFSNPYPDFTRIDELASPKNLKAAQEIANQSITLIKNSNHLLPINRQVSIPIIWPKEYEKSFQVLLKNCSNLKPHLISIEPSDEERNTLQEKIQDIDIKIIASYDLHRNVEWKELVDSLSNEKTILIVLRSPYDFLKVTDYGAAIATYGDRPVSIEALGNILKGEIQPNGQLPVEIPGRYQLGWGLKEF